MSTYLKNNKGLVFLVIILLLSNIGVLCYFLVWNKPEGGPPKGNFSVVDHMKKEVGFSEDQAKEFRQLLELNRDSMKRYSEQVRTAKTDLYKLLQQQPAASDSQILATAARLASQQEAMELVMFRHFQRVRRLCTTDQIPKFDSMVTKMSSRAPWSRRGGQPPVKQDTLKKD